MKPFDIKPYTLPNEANETNDFIKEYLFEDPRDIKKIDISFESDIDFEPEIFYMQKIWPEHKIEKTDPIENPFPFGWFPIDDHYNTEWRKAFVCISKQENGWIEITFNELKNEFPDIADYDVNFRRTLGLRIVSKNSAKINDVKIFTNSQPIRDRLKVLLDAGKSSDIKQIKIKTYNTEINNIISGINSKISGKQEVSISGENATFEIEADYMLPSHDYCNDEGLITFSTDKNDFTISLETLKNEGPIWYEDQGIYITLADSDKRFEKYKESIKNSKLIREIVQNEAEQSLGGALGGQPRAHEVPYSIGCKGSRHRFWLDPNGDITLPSVNVKWPEDIDTPRFKNDLEGRFFFGFERWHTNARYTDPEPVIAYNIEMSNGNIVMKQKSFAYPLMKSIFDETYGCDTTAALVKFNFTNKGRNIEKVCMPIQYSSDAIRVHNRIDGKGGGIRPKHIDDDNLPICGREDLQISDIGESISAVYGSWNDENPLRCLIDTGMEINVENGMIILGADLPAGESCEAIVKIPFINIDTEEEISALRRMNFDACYRDIRDFWIDENIKGAQIKTPDSRLNALYSSHLSYVHVTDFVMPNDHYLINTSVGTSTYPNFCNESCMIIQELDQRGLHEEARRRLSVWLKYQSTKGLIGNFTDHDGVFYGAGGFECGETYDQHHGWVMWYLCEHYFMTHDDKWMNEIADNIIKAAEWVFRQRKNTLEKSPFSHGFENGFIPAGSLEDVADFYYWLSTNTMTWRGVDNAAKALEAINHPKANEIRKKADEYKASLIEGFTSASSISPLVRLRDGRWVPHFPSRLYRRGRDIGWIREVLEGAVYLLISNLFDTSSKEADWILDDYLDNRYLNLPYAYVIWNKRSNWFDYGGFSPQPNLLAGLMPHLDRDEPEIYIWMFFNAWASCYREEINAMVEHPSPILGFSNVAHPKTSDEANAVMWLRYMFVYGNDKGLYIGRAIPRAWFKDDETVSAERVSTKYGDVSVLYKSSVKRGSIAADVDLTIKTNPKEMFIRFRHPDKKSISCVTIDGIKTDKFDLIKGDVDISGINGKSEIVVSYNDL